MDYHNQLSTLGGSEKELKPILRRRSYPWREAFSEYSDEELSGVALRGARTKDGLTQKQLSERLGITQGQVSEMERGKRPIGRNMAKRLGLILKVDYNVFL